jgi:hypothetical protein
MVEANKCADAGDVERSRVLGIAGCMCCHGHGFGRLPQEFDLDVLPGSASSPESLGWGAAGLQPWLLIVAQLKEPRVANVLEVKEAQ